MNVTGPSGGAVYIPTQLIAPSVPTIVPITLPTPDASSDPTPNGCPFVDAAGPAALDVYV